MAEAMLQEEYKTSHTNLKEWGDENEMEEAAKQYQQREESEEKGPTTNPKEHRQDTSREKKSDMRSVVIKVPPKRRRISNTYSINEVVNGTFLYSRFRLSFQDTKILKDYKSVTNDESRVLPIALNNGMSEQERFDALYKAVNAFDHDNRDVHDDEIKSGVDIALVKFLAFLEFKTGFRRQPYQADIEAITREICMACQALEMVYRGSSEAVGCSFKRVGRDLLHILVILIDEEVKSRMQALSPNGSPQDGQKDGREIVHKVTGATKKDQDSRSVTPPPFRNAWGVGSADRDMMLRRATKILGHFARVGEATSAVAHFPGLLGSGLNLINLRPHGKNVTMSGKYPFESSSY